MRIVTIFITVFYIIPLGTVLGREQSLVTADDLANLRDIGGHAHGAINVSPNGDWVVFQLQDPNVSEKDFELSWIALSTRKGNTRFIADGGEIILNPGLRGHTVGDRPPVRAQWSSDSKKFAYLMRRHQETQIWLSQPDRPGQIQLTHNSANVIGFEWSPDDTLLYFHTSLDRSQVEGRIKEEGDRGFLFDDRFHPRISKEPFQRNCGEKFSKPSPVSIARECDPVLWVYDFSTRRERLASEAERESYRQSKTKAVAPNALQSFETHHLRRTQDGNRYAWLENADPKTYHGPYAPLNLFALVDGIVRKCSHEECRAYAYRGYQDIWWRNGGDEVIFLRRAGYGESQSALFAWSPDTDGIRRILQGEDWLTDCDLSEDQLICLRENWTQPRQIVAISLDGGAITNLYDPNPQFSHHRFSKIEKLEWQDEYGNPTYGHLVYPANYDPTRTYPLVIVTYQSRGFLRGGVGDEYPIHPLAAAGLFVLSQDMPFAAETATRKSDPNAKLEEDQYKRKSVLSSQENIIEILAAAGLIDKSRIAITGLSEGAAQTTYALIHSHIQFRAAIASGAWDSPSSYYLMNDHSRAWWSRLSDGTPDETSSSVRALSVGLNAERVQTPLLINVSDQEILGSIENVNRLRDAGKPVEMYIYPDEFHIKWRPDHRLSIYRRNIQWMKYWLLNETDPEPVSPGQYERWSKLCDSLTIDHRPMDAAKEANCH